MLNLGRFGSRLGSLFRREAFEHGLNEELRFHLEMQAQENIKAGMQPEEARKAKICGVVLLETIIDEKGNITDVYILKGLPMGLADAAVTAVKQWRFEQATLNGKPVAVPFNLSVNFQLE